MRTSAALDVALTLLVEEKAVLLQIFEDGHDVGEEASYGDAGADVEPSHLVLKGDLLGLDLVDEVFQSGLDESDAQANAPESEKEAVEDLVGAVHPKDEARVADGQGS